MDLKKIKAIVNWQDPKNVKNLRIFLRFCNYYKKFYINNNFFFYKDGE